MIILNRPQTDPFFNLAAEEFLIKNTTEPLFMLWQNTPSVVVGKHQNALKEINLKFLKEKNIPVIRRISGGGTVFHDLGNLNYSFINFGHRESLVNFKKYSQPIVDVLQKMGVDAQLIGKSDLKIKGLKFSGNASHVYKNKVLHHGTLLFSSELNILNNSIKVSEINFSDKAVQSNRSTVTNIQSHLKEALSIEEFKQKIIDFVMTSFPETEIRYFTKTEIEEIQKLADEKYKSWEWNFGYSPRYQYSAKFRFNDKTISFKLTVKNGEIESCHFDLNTNAIIKKLEGFLTGSLHQSLALATIYDTNTKLFKELGLDKNVFLKTFIG
ncbi:MAG: lipoate--protein ligase family protein [Bacteroidetes bacterium]|nr:MAG: lipoate--protein ligase family protein [Bacteroidota bacterium]